MEETEAQTTSWKTKWWKTAGEPQNVKQIKRSEDTLRGPWDTIKWNDIHFIGVPEGEQRRGQKNYMKK